MNHSYDRFNIFVLSVASIFFAASAYNGIQTWSEGRRIKGQEKEKKGSNEAKIIPSQNSSSLLPKLSSQSAVHKVTYVTKPEDCQSFHHANQSDQRPKLHAGALFKLIDIAAGVAARRHAGRSCVTISVDSVVLLKPIYLGDLIHVSASVNRAWGSSMEIGVRIVKESASNGVLSMIDNQLEYVSHSYLTFVAINKSSSIENTQTSLIDRTCNLFFHSSTPSKPVKPMLAPIKPMTRLESRRHLLAGRRRNKRLSDAKNGRTREGVSIEVKSKVREEMQEMMYSNDKQLFTPAPRDLANAIRGNELLRTIELEVLIQAWAQGEEFVSVHDGMVEVNMPGDEPLIFTEMEVRKKAKSLGIKLPGDEKFDPEEYRLHGSATPTWAQASISPPSTPSKRSIKLPNPSQFGEFRSASPFSPSSSSLKKVENSPTISVSQTLTTSMYIVFPQHTNSVGIIFGGNTMSWSEEVAIMACRKLRVKGVNGYVNWKTVSMDGLEFNVQVGVGELMILSAIVVRTYSRSCEVYVLAQAEDRQGNRRFTNDVLFTLAYCKETSGVKEGKGVDEMDDDHITTQIVMPKGSALESFAEASQLRRQQRLELRQMLIRVYGNQESAISATEQ